MSEWLVRPCSDCGFDVRTTEGTLAKGNSVREPGEALCSSCSSARTRLVELVKKIPDTLQGIRARRTTGGF